MTKRYYKSGRRIQTISLVRKESKWDLKVFFGFCSRCSKSYQRADSSCWIDSSQRIVLLKSKYVVCKGERVSKRQPLFTSKHWKQMPEWLFELNDVIKGHQNEMRIKENRTHCDKQSGFTERRKENRWKFAQWKRVTQGMPSLFSLDLRLGWGSSVSEEKSR